MKTLFHFEDKELIHLVEMYWYCWNKYVDNDNRKKLTQGNMKKIKILCPPLPLQQEFVAIATQAEATKESLRKSIENIDQVIKSLINQ
jgi:restriction endonuclease S subunit